jgi:hypothetical protein
MTLQDSEEREETIFDFGKSKGTIRMTLANIVLVMQTTYLLALIIPYDNIPTIKYDNVP